MRHVTDGELHTYLDGGLDLLPGERGEEVRVHLASCPVCRERLQDEESLRSKAKEVLGEPDLSTVSLPTFEELRERAEAPGLKIVPSRGESDSQVHYRGPLRGLPLAWAATVVLALGVGWMGNQVFRSLPVPENFSFSSPASDEADLSGDAGALEAAVGRSGEASSPGGVGQVPTREDLPAQRADQEEGRPVGGEVPEPAAVGESPDDMTRAAEFEEARRTAPEVARAAVPSPGVLPDSLQATRVAAPPRGVLPDSLPDEMRAMLLESPLRQARARVDPQTVPANLSRVSDSIGAVEFENRVLDAPPIPDSLENSMAVPGLELLSVEWEESVPGERALHIRQLMPTGDTLELRYLGMLLGSAQEDQDQPERAVPPVEGSMGKPLSPQVLEASLPPGWNQVVMRWGRGWLVARGPLSQASLRGLVQTIH